MTMQAQPERLSLVCDSIDVSDPRQVIGLRGFLFSAGRWCWDMRKAVVNRDDFDDDDDLDEFDDELGFEGDDDDDGDMSEVMSGGGRGGVRKERPLKSWSDRAILQAAGDVSGPECLVVLTHGTRLATALRPQRSVTDEPRSPGAFWEQPEGPRLFSRPTSWLAPHRPLRVCSSLAPRWTRKSLAAKHQPLVRHDTSRGR